MGKSQQGAAFESQIRNALKYLKKKHEPNFWFTRIFDYKTYVRINPMIHAFKMPADFYAIWGGRVFYFECKSSMANRYLLSYIKQHQEKSAVELEKAGARYWFLILHRLGRARKRNRLFALRPEQWFKVKEKVRNTPYKGKFYVSASWQDIQNHSLELHRRHRVWDLEPLLVENRL